MRNLIIAMITAAVAQASTAQSPVRPFLEYKATAPGVITITDPRITIKVSPELRLVRDGSDEDDVSFSFAVSDPAAPNLHRGICGFSIQKAHGEFSQYDTQYMMQAYSRQNLTMVKIGRGSNFIRVDRQRPNGQNLTTWYLQGKAMTFEINRNCLGKKISSDALDKLLVIEAAFID